MNPISCKNHPGNLAIFLLWNSSIVQFACNECDDNQSKLSSEKKLKKLTIKKALQEPDYFIKQFNLDETSQRIMNNLQSKPDSVLKELIENLEKSIKDIQIMLEQAIIQFKGQILHIIKCRDQFRTNLGKISYYTQFTQLINNLNNQKVVSHDFVNEIENNIQILFFKMQKNTAIFNQEVQKQYVIPKLDKKEGNFQIQQLQQRLMQFRKDIHPIFENNLSRFSNSLKFSQNQKHQNCKVSQNGKLIETELNVWQCCLCDQMIPTDCSTQFAFKIIELKYVMIGIGFRDTVQSKYYGNCSGLGAGTYCIYNSGLCYSNDQSDMDNKYIGFGFSVNDIIIVEVNIQKKIVKWTKQSTNQSFSMNIDIQKELYPCIQLNDRCKIEILDYPFE
ncbi:unnamed protein product [Paramecium sonneborni]|uniref:SPRY domain-containing protein n=1 Tax=Paramecium sonneborni TaxID=65129 RepID=A0A8S1QHG7_9CILI|nr:unnamed protein product [Paramecium sonneborni]